METEGDTERRQNALYTAKISDKIIIELIV